MAPGIFTDSHLQGAPTSTGLFTKSPTREARSSFTHSAMLRTLLNRQADSLPTAVTCTATASAAALTSATMVDAARFSKSVPQGKKCSTTSPAERTGRIRTNLSAMVKVTFTAFQEVQATWL